MSELTVGAQTEMWSLVSISNFYGIELTDFGAETAKLEDLLHRFFDGARPRDLWIMDRFGRKIHPREWFYVLPEHVSRAVRAIQDGTLHELEYDPKTQIIRKMPASSQH